MARRPHPPPAMIKPEPVTLLAQGWLAESTRALPRPPPCRRPLEDPRPRRKPLRRGRRAQRALRPGRGLPRRRHPGLARRRGGDPPRPARLLDRRFRHPRRHHPQHLAHRRHPGAGDRPARRRPPPPALAETPQDWPAFAALTHRNGTLAICMRWPRRWPCRRAPASPRLLLRIADAEGTVRATQEDLGRLAGMSRAAFRRAFGDLIAAGVVELEYARPAHPRPHRPAGRGGSSLITRFRPQTATSVADCRRIRCLVRRIPRGTVLPLRRISVRRSLTMTTRRQFIGAMPATGAAFAIAGHVVFDESQARAETAAPHAGHFHPKGKAPSAPTIQVLHRRKGHPALCRHPRFRRAEKGFHRADARSEDHGRCRPCRLGHGAVPVSERGPGV